MKYTNKIILALSILLITANCSEKKEDDSASTIALLALAGNTNTTQTCAYQTNGVEVKYTLFNASTSATSMGTLTTLSNSAIKATVTAGQKIVFSGINFSGSILASVYTKSSCPITVTDLTSIANFTKTNNTVGGSLSYEISFSVTGTYIILFQGVSAQGVNVVVQ